MGDDLEERLKSHARAFEGLMSLIPAKEYYGKDASITSEQWRKTKKQTKEEWQAAKRAKLDPASHKTAKDVLDENARKRKRELEGEESSDIDMDVQKEKPLEGLKAATSQKKKQKTGGDAGVQIDAGMSGPGGDGGATLGSRVKAKADKRKQRLEKRKKKLSERQQKMEVEKAQQEELSAGLGDDKCADEEAEGEGAHMGDEHGGDRIQAIDVSGITEDIPSTGTSSTGSNASATSVVSAASSTTSIIPPSTANPAEDKKDKRPFKWDPAKHEAFQNRLTLKLEAMRAARKADGPDGRPARNRAELIEARRKKEAERKASKKASRQVAKEDEARVKAEAELARLRGSGSPSLFPMRTTPEQEHNLAFGRVAWKDGQQLDSSLSGFIESRKRKGPSDPKTALEAAQKKQSRINGLDEAKRKDIEEKDLWLTAKKRAQGEKVHDDPALLRKSLKRTEKLKAKSKQEWKDRLTNVQTGKFMKQKKREQNLQKRKEEKGGSKGKKTKKPGKKVKRPGFEGTFKAR
ncbi:SURF6-domain-containing protein [Lindgomyces ingoldianus]|uniref:SURF6-domain-containing protein n=1 Tax=Lindgomyces ingoldianus TaxID=673940 RepID=A0ACB6RHZ0_9PLEO|nr:SURF6-domain-containing protein [Lindgomyces ingoldianus]KAF2477950.1 SURF6-domain-containing protein [Lindgomyces ingoldianus]